MELEIQQHREDDAKIGNVLDILDEDDVKIEEVRTRFHFPCSRCPMRPNTGSPDSAC
jgi:hypothetical protein